MFLSWFVFDLVLVFEPHSAVLRAHSGSVLDDHSWQNSSDPVGAEDGTLGIYKASSLTTMLILQFCTGFSYWSVGPYMRVPGYSGVFI